MHVLMGTQGHHHKQTSSPTQPWLSLSYLLEAWEGIGIGHSGGHGHFTR
jgi:hypothetical protein